MVANLTINPAGAALIKRYEGYSAIPYICPAGLPTIGWGHVISAADAVKYAGGITIEQAEALFAADVRIAAAGVASLIRIPLTSNQHAALVSFVFNLGAGRLRASTLRAMLNRGEYAGAADQFMRWVYAGKKKLRGLERRRAEERALFLARLS
jgi:lysozyme